MEFENDVVNPRKKYKQFAELGSSRGLWAVRPKGRLIKDNWEIWKL